MAGNDDDMPDVQEQPSKMSKKEIDEEIAARMSGGRPTDNSRVSDLIAERNKKK